MPAPRRAVVVGGGAIGSAVALFTCRLLGTAAHVTVVERDPAYRHASSALSASSIRQQFSNPVNIRLSQFGVDCLRDPARELGLPERGSMLAEGGYLYLASAAGAPVLARNHRVQRANGADIAWLDAAGLASRFPWLAVDDLSAGCLGLSGEGWFDGYALLQGMRSGAQSAGAKYLHDEVVAFDMRGDRIVAVRTRGGERLGADFVVNAAGPWARTVARLAGIELPVHARRRTVFVVSCPTPVRGSPLVVDPSGIWFRPEGADGRRFLCGTSPMADEPDPDDLPLEPDLRLFDSRIWPAMAHRVPAFEALRVESAWAGYYEFNPFDHNGIVGSAPTLRNFLFANGFSGHGIQHSPGVGRALAEWMAFGEFRSIDLSPLGFARIARGEPFVEANVI